MASSGEFADCNQLNTAHATFPFSDKHESPSLEPVLGLSILSYCTNMVVQHGRPVPFVDIKGCSEYYITFLSPHCPSIINTENCCVNVISHTFTRGVLPLSSMLVLCATNCNFHLLWSTDRSSEALNEYSLQCTACTNYCLISDQ